MNKNTNSELFNSKKEFKLRLIAFSFNYFSYLTSVKLTTNPNLVNLLLWGKS